MTIQLPKIFNGKPIAGSLEKVLARDKEKKEGNREEITNAPNKDNFIYIPSINLYVAKQRSHLGLNWYKTHEALHQERLLMPTIPQFIAFINHLRENPQGTADASQSEIESILDDISTVRNPWRAEWLDADFKVVNEKLYIHYNHRTINNNLIPQITEILEDYLTKNRIPGIDVDDWLKNPGKHGLPKPTVKKGSLYYWAPMKDNNSVAGFGAGSGWAGLGCLGGPSGSGASLGVYASFQRS